MRNLPDGWGVRKLGEVCELISGQHIDSKDYNTIQKGIGYITGPSDFGSKYPLVSKWTEYPKRTALKNDILITVKGSGVGSINIMSNDELCISRQLMAIRCQRIELEYLYYYLSMKQEYFHSLNNGAAIPGISRKNVLETAIPLPPLSEQKRIVAKLDEAFAAIDKAKANIERNIENARELFQSKLTSVFSNNNWKKYRLGELCNKVEYGSSSKSVQTGDVPVIRMGNIQNGRIEWDNLVYSNNEEENSKYLLKYNDVLFNRTNSPELVGKTAIYKGEKTAIFAGYLIRVHRNENLLNADFLNYYLNSSIAIQYGKSVMSSSVNQANINGTKLKDYPISVPDLVEQERIVVKLDNIATESNRLEALYSSKICSLESLRKTILQKAFQGEL